MRIKFYAHASFRLEGNDVAIVTDPYTPGPDASAFEPINETADIVIMSSATDRFHSDPSHVLGDPIVINALDIPPEGLEVRGVAFQAFPAMESLEYDYGRDPEANAMYSFTLDGLRVLHLGDLGNPVPEQHLQVLEGNVDVLFALAGGEPTIRLDDLQAAIEVIRPRIVVPMHYHSPRGVLDILPVRAFTERYPLDSVVWVGGSEMTLSREALPQRLLLYVLEQSR
ncbi:MAG TPA: MBL fold metallo-hydrolase [Ardenticatenaceae bacterium]|nr:MBL fold metallo-hydrolase [Ardenticatenaceae bacterium]